MSSSEDIGEGSNNHQAEPRRGLDEQRQESSFNAPVFIPSRQGKEPEASSNTPEPALSTTPSIPSSTPHVASNPATKPVQHARPLSGASFAPSQSSMVFGHRKVNLQILDYTRLWRKLHYRALPVLAYWHVPVLIYLDFNALYILAEAARYSDRAWWVIFALYLTITSTWFFGVLLLKQLGSACWSNQLPPARRNIFPIYLDACTFDLACMSNFSQYSFLQRARLSALSEGDQNEERDLGGFLCQEGFWIIQSWATTLLHALRAVICVALLLVFKYNGENPSRILSGKDSFFFTEDRQLSTYSVAVLLANCSWSALRLLMLLCAFVSYTSLAGTTGLLFLFKGRPRAVDSKESDVENYPGLSVWPQWVLRLEDRMERIYGFCDHSSPADVQTTHAPTNIRTASPLQALRTSNSRRASMATSARAGTRDAPTTATTCSTPLKQELANSSMQRQHNSPQATSSSRRMPSRPFSTIARALEAEEMLSSEDDPNSSAESGQNSMGDSSSGSPAQSSDPGLSTIEERTEISERIHSRPLSGVSAIRRSIDETRQSPRILPRSLTEETGEESEAYSTAADSSAASIPRAEPIDDRQ